MQYEEMGFTAQEEVELKRLNTKLASLEQLRFEIIKKGEETVNG